MGLIQDLMQVISGAGRNGPPRPMDEHIPGMDTDPYGRPKLPALVDPGMGNDTPVSKIRIPRDPGMSFPAPTNPQPIPLAPINPPAPEPIPPADPNAPIRPEMLTAQATPGPRTGKLTDDMAATSKVDSVGQPPTVSPAPAPAPAPAAPLPPNTTAEVLDKDLMNMSAGMPNLRGIYDDSQAQIVKQRADINALEHPTLKSMFQKFIPSLALTGLGAAMGGKRGMARGAIAGMGYPMGVAERKKAMYDAKNKNVETEEGRQDKAVESGIRAREVAARLSEARDYHTATVGVRQQHEDTFGTRYQQQDDLNARKAGLARGEDGVLHPLPPDQLTPQQRAVLDNTQEGANLKRSIEDLDAAKAELARAQNDPNSAAYKLALRKVDAAMYGHQIAAGNLGLKSQQWEYSMYGTQGGVAVPGQATIPVVGADGKPTGEQTPIGDKPLRTSQATTTSRTMGEMAGTMRKKIPTLKAMIDDLDKKGKLGPLAGRYEEFMAGTVGDGDPDYAKFRSEMSLFNSGMMRTHLGARGGAQFMKEFKGLWNGGKMSGKTLKASIDGADAFLKDYEGFQGPTAGKKTTAPARSANAGAPNWDTLPDGSVRRNKGTGLTETKVNGKWVGSRKATVQ